MRNDTTVFVGLDVHKDSIVAAYAIGAGEIQDLGNVGVLQRDWIDCAPGCAARERGCASSTKRVLAAMRCIDTSPPKVLSAPCVRLR